MSPSRSALLDRTAPDQPRDAPTPPFRRISRISNEMHLSGMSLVHRMLPFQYDRSIVLLVVMRVCAPDWTGGGTFRAPAAATRFVSINRIASSLHRPFETVRRHVHALLEAGICVAHPEGITLAPEPVEAFDPIALFAAYNDLLVGFAEDLAAFGLLPAPAPRPAATLRLDMIEAALDVALMPFEKFGTLFGDWTAMRIWSCIGALNVRHVMLDPELDARYAWVSTPDDVRRPVSLRTVARTLDIPYATAWRHARVLHDRGLVSEAADGWLVRRSHLRDEHVEQQVVEGVLYYLRRLGVLVRGGMDPRRADAGYIVGRAMLTVEL